MKSCFCLLLLSISVINYSATLYVSPKGHDRNSGEKLSEPWRTLAKANSVVRPGDIVLIAAGTYLDQIRPMRSGTSNSARITYKALGDGPIILTAVGNTSKGSSEDVGAIALGGRSFITVDGVRQFIRVVPDAKPYIALGNFNNAYFNEINSVYFDGSTQTAKGGCVFLFNYLYGVETESSFNALRNSHLEGRIGSSNEYTEDVIQVAGNAHHNLIDGNTIFNARHVTLNVGSFTVSVPNYNVIRNNVIGNAEHTALQLYNKGPYSNLIEGNYISASGGKPVASTSTNPGNAIEYSGSQSIFRYNVITKGGATDNHNEALGGFVISVGGEGSRTVVNNRIYNNTIVKNNGTPLGVLDFGTTAGAILGHGVYVNNFVYAASSPAGGRNLVKYWDDRQNTNDRFIRNVFGNPDGNEREEIIDTKAGKESIVSAIKSSRPPSSPDFRSWNGFANTYDSAPGFANFAIGDFTLLTSSKYIDAGAPLTKVSISDSRAGQLLLVDDSRFFQDGMGIPALTPDWIAVGSIDNVAQISSLNHSTNSITLRNAILRNGGDSIWLFARSNSERVFKGSAPDIGAYEAILSALPIGSSARTFSNLNK